MMVVDRRSGTIRHARFREFAGTMGAGDLLVLNDTRVLPARLWGTSGEAKIEFLFIRETGPGAWEVLCRPAKRVREGDTVRFPGRGRQPGWPASAAKAGASSDFGQTDVRALLHESGYAPLPPYIKRAGQDERARPAGYRPVSDGLRQERRRHRRPDRRPALHRGRLAGSRSRGVDIRRVTFDVGLATFQPSNTS